MSKQPATGALLGLALGDALGYPTEFKTVPLIETMFGPWRELEFAASRAGLRRHADDPRRRAGPAHGHGARTPRAEAAGAAPARGVRGLVPVAGEQPRPGWHLPAGLQLLKAEGRLWQDASQLGSKGCGANMRVAPSASPPGLSDEQRAGAAQLQAALTHGHPTALAAADLTAHAVHLLARGTDPAGLIGRLRSYALEHRTRYDHAWLGDLWTRSQDPGPEHFIARGWDECLEILRPAPGGRADRLPGDRPLPGHRRGLDRRGGPRHRAAVLPALP